ncbi:DUF2157 domain-containing protein [Amphritea japonica]|uniref:DUF2157 domain-containing protein n=1 Tax=Amphritea japonica ATCC BAA-1530 TaxID=1278309 RepID=A0A7R6P3V7_9GAMM|nr:DUF2157 domain-containing protein [Amphritea japonica]BBB26554.1 conserved hypothetical protein [Amphritea japonica ATCC BAA-1530]
MMSLLVVIVIVILIGGGFWGWPLLAGALGISNITNKADALRHIRQLMNTYDITPAEVEIALSIPASEHSATHSRSKGDIAKILFALLGSIFIFAGISTYIGMFWDSMGSVMRVLITLGVGYVLLIILISALQEEKFPKFILPLTCAAVFMMTSGWFVLIHELYPQGDNWRTAVLAVFAVMGLQQGVLFGKYRRTALLFTSLFFAYGFLEVGLDLLGVPVAYISIVLGSSIFLVATALEKSPHRVLAEPALLIGACWLNSGLFDRIDLFTSTNWASLITGTCIMLTAYGMHKTDRYPRLIALGYFIGSIMAYVGLFDLLQNSAIELLYLAVTASTLYACVVLQSRALLLTTVIAMLSFIVYFSEKHFANSLGWPVTLVLIGIAFLGVGAIAIKLKKRM